MGTSLKSVPALESGQFDSDDDFELAAEAES
jgi:hypothetical protein